MRVPATRTTSAPYIVSCCTTDSGTPAGTNTLHAMPAAAAYAAIDAPA